MALIQGVICKVLSEAYNRRWITSRDGNVSYRYKGANEIYITPSGSRKHQLDAHDIVVLPILPDGSVKVNGTPSGELEMHRMLLVPYKSARAVIHLHPTYTIAAMEAGIQLDKLAQQFPELNRYTRVAPNVPAIAPTTKDLATAVSESLGLNADGTLKYDIVGLTSHGVTAVGNSPQEAFEHIERLEHIAQIVLAGGRW